MTSKDTAIKARIITHMNADHSTSLTRYLEHFCLLPSPKDAQLEEIHLDHLIVSSNGSQTRNIIPFDPPLRSYVEARERLIAMDEMALEGLGRSDIGAIVYERPRGWMAVMFWACFTAMVVFCRRGNFVEGSLMHHAVLKYLPPSFLRFSYVVQPLLFYIMAAVHLSEAGWMAYSRLKRHRMALMGGLWWKWILSTFVEGYGAFLRFDELVRKEEERGLDMKKEAQRRGKEARAAITAAH
jgi:hypothetical protein